MSFIGIMMGNSTTQAPNPPEPSKPTNASNASNAPNASDPSNPPTTKKNVNYVHGKWKVQQA